MVLRLKGRHINNIGLNRTNPDPKVKKFPSQILVQESPQWQVSLGNMVSSNIIEQTALIKLNDMNLPGVKYTINPLHLIHLMLIQGVGWVMGWHTLYKDNSVKSYLLLTDYLACKSHIYNLMLNTCVPVLYQCSQLYLLQPYHLDLSGLFNIISLEEL